MPRHGPKSTGTPFRPLKFLFCSYFDTRTMVMARSSAALRNPPVPVPPSKAPAGGFVRPRHEPERSIPDTTGLLDTAVDKERRRGRGTLSNASGRYESVARIAFDDGWQSLDELPPFKTSVQVDATRKIITRNESPDIGF